MDFPTLNPEAPKFLRFELSDLQCTDLTQEGRKYDCFVLPEPPSGFPRDHKIVAFYADPGSLMELSYVLRKDSWRDLDGLYQRMLIKNKIKAMREYLASEGRVYVNNIIVSLPDTVRFIDKKNGNNVNPSSLVKNTYLQVELPKKFNSVGLIDGQHRVFSYYEGKDQYEKTIAQKRVKQQLLVTGVIFPHDSSDEERAKFEAKLFLEINDRQTRTKGDLRQAIQVIVNPYNSIAVAKAIVNRMSIKGPLSGLLETHYFGDGTIKTTSLVSYGLSHIVAFRNNIPQHSLYNLWKSESKDVLSTKDDRQAWEAYVDFCTNQINSFFDGFKITMSKQGMWTTDRKKSKALVITAINGLVYCLRLLITNNRTGDRDYYEKCFSKMGISFAPNKFSYKSSHWKALGIKVASECFGVSLS